MAATKFLNEDGVRRLWAAIEAKFLDGEEIADIIANLPAGTCDMVAMTYEDIDNITGYVAPVPVDNGDEPNENENP